MCYIVNSELLFIIMCPGIMADLDQWVKDRLHDILGLSDKHVAQFMIGTAKRSSGPEDFVSRLKKTGTIDIDQTVVSFAHELYGRVSTFFIPLVRVRNYFIISLFQL